MIAKEPIAVGDLAGVRIYEIGGEAVRISAADASNEYWVHLSILERLPDHATLLRERDALVAEIARLRTYAAAMNGSIAAIGNRLSWGCKTRALGTELLKVLEDAAHEYAVLGARTAIAAKAVP